MPTNRIRSLAARVPADPLAGGPGRSDADLLTRFLNFHDERAFEALVGRHLAGVRAVCRAVLRREADADDAVQATFLVLVRRAATVRDRGALGAWLGRVAWRAANRLRAENDRRGRSTGADPDTVAAPEQTGVGADAAAILSEEVGRLPERYRLVVLMCYAGGVSAADAAERLGWPRGTVLTRLAWAKKRLRARLTRRGVAPAAALTSLAGSVGSVGGAAIATRTAAAAVALALGGTGAKELVSERVLSLTEGVVRTMFGTKLKIALAVAFLAVALLGLGLGRMTAEPAGDGEKRAAVPLQKGVVGRGAAAAVEAEAEPAKDEAPPAAPPGAGKPLVVRRPAGSFTREVAPYGRGTLTFTENRLHVHATFNLDDLVFSVVADADYSINTESTVYGVITGVDLVNVAGGKEAAAAAELGVYAAAVTDTPFAFRIRVEDDAITVKDIKLGPLGSRVFELFDGGKGNEDLLVIAGMIGGKFRADPDPDHNALPPAGRPGNTGRAAPLPLGHPRKK